MNNILVVEDNHDLASTVSGLLEAKLKAQAETALNLDQAFAFVDHHHLDLIVLDWLLGSESGLDLLDYLKQYSFQTKILMISQKSQLDERLISLKQGVDSFLAKPFDLNELIIKVERLLSFYRLVEQEKIRLKPFELNVNTGLLKINDLTVSLATRETQIMSLLMVNSPQVLSKMNIINQIWTKLDNQPQINTVEVYVRRIRSKLGQYSSLLKTKRGFGYFLDKGK
jgi:two-component system response regulator VicR